MSGIRITAVELPLTHILVIYLSFRIRFSEGPSRSLRKGGDFFAKSKGICFPEFFRSLSQPRRQVVLVYSPSARSRGPPDSTFRAMSHFPHPSSAGAEYFSPASERWVEISHDRALQGRHNHALWLRFRLFFAKAGRQSSPQCGDGSLTRPGRTKLASF